MYLARIFQTNWQKSLRVTDRKFKKFLQWAQSKTRGLIPGNCIIISSEIKNRWLTDGPSSMGQFFKECIYLLMSNTQRQRSGLHAACLMLDLSSVLRYHALSQRQTLNHWGTQMYRSNFLNKDFFLPWETYRERQRHRQREDQAPCRESNVGFDPGTPGSCPGPKADTKLLSHPGIPTKWF